MFSDPFSIIVALVVILCITVTGILVAINQNQRKRALRTQQNIPIQPPTPRWYSLLIVLTDTAIDTNVTIKGYGLFSYVGNSLYESIESSRSLIGASSDITVTKPIMNIVSLAVRNKTYEFFTADEQPNIQPDDTIPVCLIHDKVLYFIDKKITACPDTFGMRTRSGALKKEHKTRPLGQNSPLFILRSVIATDKKWTLL